MAEAMSKTRTKIENDKKKNDMKERHRSLFLRGSFMALDDYRARVEALACAKSGDPIFNGSLDHAEIIVEKMFSHAGKTISILTGKLNARVYGTDQVREQARLFLADASHHVSILMEDSDPKNLEDHPFIEEFALYRNIEFKAVPDDMRALYDFHFLVMDEDSYRFEEDKTKPTAIAAFGDKLGAGNIQRIFNSLWADSQPLSVAEYAKK